MKPIRFLLTLMKDDILKGQKIYYQQQQYRITPLEGSETTP